MVEVHLSVWITAEDDNEADAVIGALSAAGRRWPETPIVAVRETERNRLEQLGWPK